MKVYKFSHSFFAAILTAVLCISGNLLAYSGGLSWQLISNTITARDQFAGCVIDDNIYVFGGNGNPDGINLRSGEVYNINTSSWSSIASNTSEGIEELSGVGLNGKFYVFGGWGGIGPSGYYGVINFNKVYNPATNTWTTLAQKPTITAGSMPAVYNGKIYLFGGDYAYEDNNGNEIFYQAYPNVEAYDPATNTWQSKTPMPKLLMNPAIAVYGNSAYIIGGYDPDAGAMNTEVMVYNFASNTWTRNYCIAPTEAARVYSYASITPVIDGKAYLIGGIEGSLASSWSSDKFTIFDISAKTWESQALLPEARGGHLVVVHNETPYVIGGYNDENDFNRAESSVYALLKPVNLNGQYWFGSLSADVTTNVPWGKQGTISVNGNNWVQEWNDQSGHHTFLSTFTAFTQPNGSININLSSGTYNVAWNGNVMIHADTVPDADNRLGIDMILRKAVNIDANNVVGNYNFFEHRLNWLDRWDDVKWGDIIFDSNGSADISGIESDGDQFNESIQWTLDAANAMINVSGDFPFYLCENGIMARFWSDPVGNDPELGYNFSVKKTNQTIMPADMEGKYQVRFLETGPGGVPYTCSQGICLIDANGTMHVDAWYSDGDHDVSDSNYTLGPGNIFSITGIPEQGIISPDKNMIFMPEYYVSNPREDYDWIGGIFLVRVTSSLPPLPQNIADINGDGVVDYLDLAILTDQWLLPPGTPSADLNNDGIVNFEDYAIFAQYWLGGDEISDHVFEIIISTGWDYGEPGLSTDYMYEFEVSILTDDTVNRVEFTTPDGNTFEIPNTPTMEYPIAGGYMEIGREFDSESGHYELYYGPSFSSQDSLFAYGDGLYTFTIYYADGHHQHTTAWFGIPGTTDPIPQPTQLPVITSFNHGDILTSPVTFSWQPCTDNAAENVWLNVYLDEDNEVEWTLPLSAEGLDEPLALSAGPHEAELDFVVFCDSINEDGIAISADKYSECDYYFSVGETATPPDIVWVSINDSGAGMKDENGNPISQGGFIGQMSKYETTNAQYCQFLNAALASGDITISIDNIVYGANGSNSGADFVGQIYFYIYPYDTHSQITYSDGVFSVRNRDGYDMSNHPVTSVSWYGSTAFASYYGWRLPTEWEWQAVADYDGSFTYGCGTSIDPNKANYWPNNPLGLTSEPYTSPVDYYPSYGYGMNDMAGNAWEWTDSCYYSDCSYNYRVLRGGCWYGSDDICAVSYHISYTSPSYAYSHIGFRVCR